MSNQNDDLFEDVPYNEAPASDDSLFEDVPHPEAIATRPGPESTDPLGDSTRGVIGGSLGAGAGVALNKGLEFGVNKAIENAGALRPEDIKKIDENRELYKELKKSANPLEDMLDTFRGLSEKNRQGGIDSSAAAVEALRGQPAMPINKFYNTVAKPAANNPDFSDALPENTQAKILGEKIDEIAPVWKEDSKIMAQLEEAIQAPYVDERLALRQDTKNAKFNNKMEQLSAPIQPNAKLPILDKFEDANANKKLSSLEDLLAQAKGKDIAPVLNSKEDLLFNIDNDADKAQKLREIDISRDIQPDYEKLEVKNAHADMKNARKLDRLDEKATSSQAKLDSDIQKLEQKKQDFQQSLADRKEKTSALRDVDSAKAQAKVQNQKDQLTFNKLLADEEAVKMKKLKHQAKLEKLSAQYKKLQGKMESSLSDVQKAAENDYTKLQNTPKPILDVTPELQGRVLRDGYASSLESAIKDTDRLESLELPAVHKRLRELQEADLNYGQGGAVNNFRKEMAGSLSEELKKNEDYAKNMAKAEESFKTEALWEKNGIKYNDDLKRTTLEDSGRSKINQILIDGEKNKVSKEYLVEALKDAERQGHIPKDTSIESLINRSEVAALQNEVTRLRKGGDLNAFDINSMAKGDMTRAPGITTKLGGTRLQELFGMYKNSVGGKLIKGAGKYGLPLAGGMAAYSSAADAAQTGELSPEAALLSGTAEAFSPLPGVDVIEGAKGGAKGIDQALAENTQEELTAAPEMGANDLGGADLIAQNPLVQKALSGFVKGAVSPIPGMANSAAESFSQTGTQRSTDARSRMEQNSKAADMFSKPKEEAKPHEEFKSFVEQKPEQIQDLAQFFSNDEKTASFVAPLEKAAQGDDRTRNAVLFGLYQQPAFRQAMKARSPSGK